MSDFFRQHWRPLTVALLFAIVLGTVVYRLLASTIRGAVLAVRKPKQLGESGAAAAEFVITVIPFMLMLTALMQLALASMGRVLVSYAAFCAARAAVVFVPMKPEEVEGASASSKLGQAFTEEMANHVGYGANSRTDFAISHKAALVRNAAAYALIPTSPSIDVVASDIANNWEQYLIERLKHGLDPLKYLQSLLGDIAGLPGPLLENLADQLKDVIQGGLDSPEAKKAAKDKLDAWLDGAIQGNPALRDKVKAAVDNYIDKYKGSAESPTGQLGDLVKNTINNTLSGPLEKWKDKVSQSIDASLPGGGGGAFKGYQVDRALDAGFGAGTDGASGAILRSMRKLVYAKIGTVVTILDENGKFKTKFEWNEPIRVRVTYLFYCQIPLANRFAGHPFYDLSNDTVADMATGPLKGFEIIGIPGYFMALQADHVMTNQGKPL